jgi:hypothetical protein
MKEVELKNTRTAESPEDLREADKNENWRKRVDVSKLPGIEVVMTRRPGKRVAFKDPVLEPEPVVQPVAAPVAEVPKEPVVEKPKGPGGQVEEAQGPVLPYRNVPAIDHQKVPRQRERERPIPIVTKEKAYKLKSPIEESQQGESLFDTVKKTIIPIELGRLVKASPSLAADLRKATTRTRRPLKHKAVSALFQESEFPYMEDDIECRLEYDAIAIEQLSSVDSLYISTAEDQANDHRVKAGYMVVPDPYLVYLSNLGKNEVPRQVYVANDSASLRVIFPIVDGKHQIEAVIDSGSQIVSMSLAEAEELNLGWDPDIQIYMQSANGSLKKSAGLARNVPFVFGEITVYLQVHIIDQPAYKILLGRPFDILTESQIHNTSNGNQTVTLKDPNTGKRSTLPTHARGTYSAARRAEPSLNSAAVPTTERPTKQADFKQQPSKRATVEEVKDESEETSDDEGSDSDSESEVDQLGFHQSSRT